MRQTTVKLSTLAGTYHLPLRAKKDNKYLYLFVVQGNYGYGWEDVTQAENHKEARGYLKDYRENETQYRHRLIKRREKNTGS